VVGAIRWRWTLGRSIAAFQLAAGIAILALMPQPPLVPAALVLALVGALASPLTIWAQTVRMRLIPDELRGRVFSLLRTLMQSTPPIGGIVAAGLLSGHDVAPAVVVAALLFGVPGLVGLMHPALAHAQTVAPVDGHAAAEGSVS
jgi:hypothetical protein